MATTTPTGLSAAQLSAVKAGLNQKVDQLVADNEELQSKITLLEEINDLENQVELLERMNNSARVRLRELGSANA